ncbi:unnamed protein product [Dibothriocephalus latus]|uniref:Uncharacterized protein n=1 Tax=Dibothriocephalus latus TaxID=60516 RepID=A0A3P6PEF3_DIBLA|nr:unnamed protein product [Dibothriocephalus latus]
MLTRPALAKEFLVETRNVPAIRKGKVAIIHVEPTDMLTYDILRLWRNELESGVDLGAAGQSLIIMTILPTRTMYQSNSSIYTNVSGAHLFETFYWKVCRFLQCPYSPGK